MDRPAFSLEMDRRRLLMLGAASPLVGGCGGAAAVAPAPAAVDLLRVCNADYYPAAERLLAAAPGQVLEVAFDHDPAWVEGASAGLWLDWEKVGDAPRRSRRWLGRMLNAGRRLRATVDSIRPATEYSGPACMARIELLRDGVDAPLGRAACDDFWAPRARHEQAHRYAELFARQGRSPVYLGGGAVAIGRRPEADQEAGPETGPETGDLWRLVVGAPTRWRAGQVECVALDGAVMGRLSAEPDRMARRMLEAGLALWAVVVDASPNGAWTNVAIYLAD